MIAEVAAGCTSAFICTDPAFSKTSQEDIDKENILKGYVSRALQ